MYKKKVYTAGKTKEVIKSHNFRYRPPKKREQKKNQTPEDQVQINKRQQVKKMTREINSNFGPGDIHLVMNLSPENMVDEIEELEKRLSKFHPKAKKLYASQGLEYKYIAVIEGYGKSRPHCHLVIPSIDARLLIKLWPWGYIHPNYLDSSGQYRKLAEYLLKEANKKPKGKRAWNASRNITVPEPETEIVAARTWTDNPKPEKGYYIDQESVYNGYDAAGWPYQEYTMIKLE